MSRNHLSSDLQSILDSFLDLIECDGGAIHTLEKNLQGEPVLVFKAMVVRSRGISAVPDALQSMVFRLDESTSAGKAGLSRTRCNEEFLPPRFEEGLPDYPTRNLLSAPLLTPRGDLVGVLQLFNKESEGEATGFSEKDGRLCGIVSAQASLAIENSTLLMEQEQFLDGFVNACVTAIEARDPVTSGHSQRVCDLSLGLAESVNRVGSGILSGVRFNDTELRELRYAAMLHDIGKISVSEEILKKEKKLHAWELEIIRMRMEVMRSSYRLELQGEKNRIELARRLRELDEAYRTILAANEPTVLPKAVSEEIIGLTRLQVSTGSGEVCCALHEHEKNRLCIPRGSLSAEERVEIEKHVSFTYEILKMVPWGRGLENVPLIAHRHHEKLDGSGYPLRVKAPAIPVQSRILTICDIYDALTAKDRPYKAAVPVETALSILEDEVREGKLDQALFRVFLDSGVYRSASPAPLRRVKKAA